MPITDNGFICNFCGKKIDMLLIGAKESMDTLKALDITVDCRACLRDAAQHLYAELPDKPSEGDIMAGVATLAHLARTRGAKSSTAGIIPKAVDNCRVIKSGEFEIRLISAFDVNEGRIINRLDTFIQ